jgi:hypothetical protein
LWGASLALHEGSEFVKGRVKDTNLDTYTPLRMGDVPEMEIEFLPSTEVPTGLGEPATTVVGPAVGNAIFAAAGARLRHLPIRPDAVLRALKTTSNRVGRPFRKACCGIALRRTAMKRKIPSPARESGECRLN